LDRVEDYGENFVNFETHPANLNCVTVPAKSFQIGVLKFQLKWVPATAAVVSHISTAVIRKRKTFLAAVISGYWTSHGTSLALDDPVALQYKKIVFSIRADYKSGVSHMPVVFYSLTLR
jgi:hypothetical protein